MIQKTPEEKAAIKAAKKSWRQNGYDRPSVRIQQKPSTPELKPTLIMTGLMEEEEILPDDHPVFWDFTYIADMADGSYLVVWSPIKGTVNDLKNDIMHALGHRPANIYRCNRAARNIF